MVEELGAFPVSGWAVAIYLVEVITILSEQPQDSEVGIWVLLDSAPPGILEILVLDSGEPPGLVVEVISVQVTLVPDSEEEPLVLLGLVQVGILALLLGLEVEILEPRASEVEISVADSGQWVLVQLGLVGILVQGGLAEQVDSVPLSEMRALEAEVLVGPTILERAGWGAR